MFLPTASSRIAAGGEYGIDRGVGHVPRFHQGMDIAVPVGTPLYGSSDGGVVTAVGDTGSSSGFGRYVRVSYGLESVLVAHLSRIDVAKGQRINVSTQLGLSGGLRGAPGAGGSSGPHCHIELYLSGARRNPNTLTPRSRVAGSTPVVIPPTIPPRSAEETPFMYAIIRNTVTGRAAGVGSIFADGWHEFGPGEYEAFIVLVAEQNRVLAERDRWPSPPPIGNAAAFANYDQFGYDLFRTWFARAPQTVGVATLPDDVLAQLAIAVADESDRRARNRLGGGSTGR